MDQSPVNRFKFAAPARPLDTPLLVITILLVLAGAAFFFSAALGLLARDNGPSISDIVVKQLLVGLCLGGVVLYAVSWVKTTAWRRYGFFIYLAGLITSLFVFIPGLGFEHGGATRWIILFGVSFQPSEILKFGLIAYYAALLAASGDAVRTWRGGMLPLAFVLAPVAGVLFLQPDLDTLAVIIATALAMYYAAGARAKHLLMVLAILGIGFVGIVTLKPHAMQRINTFFNPAADPSGAGYQITQSLTAVGAGGLFGRGFGQSIQKFRYLPEPMGDSIFAVTAEEFGFVGGAGLIILYVIFAGRSLTIASRAKDRFNGLLIVGIAILIVSQSFLNIASMLGLFPLSGMPLVFVSQGGTALVAALAGVGVILAASRENLRQDTH